ncbi:biotin--[acetyl-CoA-carboxylase] ligase [Limnobacter sp.]|uniref:biotin--[acetyl-CoA-carboxylase] ligase n=1 Tax=Limnobacter sp. TaxID=2003368 RepID=UPI003512CCE8
MYPTRLMVTQANVNWIELDTVDSTNTYVINACQAGAVDTPLVVLAHEQTAGRGRAGRAWQAQPGASLCMSLGLVVPGALPTALPLAIGVAVANALRAQGAEVQIKWPNDLLINSSKLGGLLCESFQAQGQTHIVVGLGINLNPMALELNAFALPCAFLHAQPGVQVRSPKAWAEYLLPAMLNAVQASAQGALQATLVSFSHLDAWYKKPLQVQDGGRVLMQGIGMGVNQEGAYLLDTEAGLKAVHAGDLSLRERA